MVGYNFANLMIFLMGIVGQIIDIQHSELTKSCNLSLFEPENKKIKW